jgi:acyl carrier protein
MMSAFDSADLDKVVLAIKQTAHVKPADIATDTRLAEDLGLGRLGRIKLAISLEEVFDLELSKRSSLDLYGRRHRWLFQLPLFQRLPIVAASCRDRGVAPPAI